jgi:hypothetical protein
LKKSQTSSGFDFRQVTAPPGILEEKRYVAKRALCEPSSPVLRPVPNVQDFDNLVCGTIHSHVRRADKFAGSLHLSGASKAGENCQLFNAINYRLSDIPGGGWIVLLDVID